VMEPAKEFNNGSTQTASVIMRQHVAFLFLL
jgi:hypothetical protein